MQWVSSFLQFLDSYLGGAEWFPFVLLGVGLFFTLYLRFPQIRYFPHALRILTGRWETPSMKGDTSHFQALTTALAGTIGTGNIGGVGLAIFIGGPAALFWMWVTAFLGMTTKFVECTLSHKYRIICDDGSIAGGPMYYMERKLNMRPLAIIFSIGTIICAFGTGNMPQINNIAASLDATMGIDKWLTGGVLSILLGAIIIGGIRRIARVTQVLVPFMCIVYVLGALSVILFNSHHLIPALKAVFADAFSGSAAAGGFLGSSFAFAFNRGVGRGLYSNEAGQGSAPIAHSAAKADEPVSEGMVAILEPFIDTLLVCSLTGMAILASGVWTEKLDNTFEPTDTRFVAGRYDDSILEHRDALTQYLSDTKGPITPFEGTLTVRNGTPDPHSNLTVLHARSIATNVRMTRDDQPFTGELIIRNGRLVDTDIHISGRSLVHSAVLTSAAFTRGYLGSAGDLIVSLGLLLFAFSTAISWSYYGDRAVTWLLGSQWILPYRICYVLAFFLASLMDTTIVWSLAAVAIVFMTIPNLLGIVLLHKDMKQSVDRYWTTRNRHAQN